MPMLQNKPLFFECFDHPEPLADPYYPSEQPIIPASPEALTFPHYRVGS